MANVPKTVLHVEDDESHRFLVHRAFSKVYPEAELMGVEDGQEAHEILLSMTDDRTSDGVDLILLDINIPRLSGLELLEIIKSENRLVQAPVVIMTSSVNPTDVQRAYELHANSYIEKAADYAELCETVSLITTYWFKVDQFVGGAFV